MLEGLEATERCYKELNSSKRFEAEFFLKKYSTLFNTLGTKKLKLLSELVSVPIQTGHTPSMKNPLYYGGDVKFIKTDNLRVNDIREPFTDSLSDLGNDIIKRTELQEGDIVTTIIGATYDIIARSCVVTADLLPANINQNIVRIRVEDLPSGYVCSYLNSTYGRMNLEYLARQMEQVNLNCEEVGQVLIPVFSEDFHARIHELYARATDKRLKARDTYKEALDCLHRELRVAAFAISPESIVHSSFSESFLACNRIDAEYYLPRYDSYLEMVRQYAGGYDTIGSLCNIVDKNYLPKENENYRYIELSNIGKNGNITGCMECEGWELPSRARRMVYKGDVIVSSVEGSLESCALVTDEFDGALCSTGFYVVRSTRINPETLLVLFKSDPIQMLMKKGCSGTILTAISRTEFDKIPLPIVSAEVQNQVARLIQESVKLRIESNRILDLARKGNLEITQNHNLDKIVISYRG